VLVLYDNPASSNALKVRVLLAELDMTCERIVIELTDERPDWYLKVQPSGMVPCLVDGEVIIRESNSILRYLAAREGREDLYPSDLATRAQIDTVMDALSINVRPFLWPAESIVIYGSPDEGRWREELAEALAAWEALLVGPDYCTGSFSIADCAAVGRLMHLERLEIDLARYPATTAMLAAVRSRPSYAAATSG
jgi:glutathione S-transferase